MSQRSRRVPRAVAEFGERQYRETGALAVEILRVKASTLRKHFAQLRGIVFLVAVISLDRIRVYFFDASGVLHLGENVSVEVYKKIRRASRLIARYEKPREPTPEELRMEATEEVRSLLARAIRRVSRHMGLTEPDFPPLFVSSSPVGEGQNFGLALDGDAFVIEEASVRASWREGLALRAAVLLHLDPDRRLAQWSVTLGNAIAYSLLRGDSRTGWLRAWLRASKKSGRLSVVTHLVYHAESYDSRGFRSLLDVLREASPPIKGWKQFQQVLDVVHSSHEVNLGTERYHSLREFCGLLPSPRRLAQTDSPVPEIHLGVRAVVNPLALDQRITWQRPSDDDKALLRLDYIQGSHVSAATVSDSGSGSDLLALEYRLELDDVVPKSGGILPQVDRIVTWALSRLGRSREVSPTVEARIDFRQAELPAAERAVLERLYSGDPQVLRDTFIGSPERMESLIRTGNLLLLPEFNHLGLQPNLLITGSEESVRQATEGAAIERTLLLTEDGAVAIVSSPPHWRVELLRRCTDTDIAVYPLLRVVSSRGLVRYEPLLPTSLPRFESQAT